MSADSTYKLDHSWLTPSSYDTLVELAQDFKSATGKKLEVNDCCLIDGYNTPEHNSHEDGKDADIRNAPYTTAEEKKFLELCVANLGVEEVWYYTNHGITSSKIIIDTGHKNHFHVDFA